MPINLTDNDDYHFGTSAAEHIIGRKGDDTIIGNGGADTLIGWAGDDELISYGSGGMLSGDTGNDYLEAKKTSYGQYHLYGGDGDDTFVMHLDNNYGWGHQGFHAYGRDQADEFRFVGVGKTNAPMLSRIDDFDASQDSIWVDGTEIDLNSLPANMRVVNYIGQQWLVIDNNVMIGLEGVRMYAPPGVPTMMGGATEMHFHAFPTNLATLATTEFIDQVNFVPYSLYEPVFGSLNQLSGTIATSSADYFYGHSENSFLDMGGGDDVVNAGKGRDTIRGGGGDDLIAGGQDNDVLFGDAGNDQIWGGSENDEISGGKGADSLHGGNGTDTASYAGASSFVQAYLFASGGGMGDAAGDVYTSIENLTGSSFGDVLAGNSGANIIRGGDGWDVLYAGYGGDSLFGEAGNDTLRGGGEAAMFDGGAGDDEIWGSTGDDVLLGGDGNDVLIGGRGGDLLDGGNGTDTASYAGASSFVQAYLFASGGGMGDAAGDVYTSIENLTGSSFGDVLAGNSGANIIRGGDGWDVLYAGYGGDSLYGEAGNDTLRGGGEAAMFDGGAGDDYILGSTGNDTLIGGTGVDVLDGGAGADEFQFEVGFGQDTVLDFENGIDLVDLANGLTYADVVLSSISGGVRVGIIGNASDFIDLLGVTLSEIDANDFI